MCYKHELLQLKEVVIERFKYSLSLTNEAWNHVPLQVMKFVYYPSTYYLSTTYLMLTCTKFQNSYIYTRPTAYLLSI
jgi:hypothetical protein